MQGFTMGGGVGIGGHASHRIVGETSQIAMPECGIGLVPDVGGSLLLARAPGRLGEYLGVTGHRMKPADALYAGFADYLVPQDNWPALISTLEETGDWTAIDAAAQPPGPAPLAEAQGWIDTTFAAATLLHLHNALDNDTSDMATRTAKLLVAGSPLSQATTLELVRRCRGRDTIEGALELEFRATTRALRDGDFLEGIRAMVIDKDKAPRWNWTNPRDLPGKAVVDMLLPLGEDALTLEETP
jgi:enoyl-CoA hydratase/carnithine racemase